MALKILIADDHPIFRNGVLSFLKSDFPDAIIDEATDGNIALAKLDQNNYEIAILDVDMPHKTGLEVSQIIKEKEMPTKVIILTIHDDPEIIRKASENGASGFLIKENTAEDLKECISTILEGKNYIAPRLRYSKKHQKALHKHEKNYKSTQHPHQNRVKNIAVGK